MSADEAAPAAKLSMPTMGGLVVGSMVGAGVFSLPARFAVETGVAGALIAWAVAGGGTFLLALVFQQLAVRRPHLDAGVYAYARAGFGEYFGFFSAFGYWASACAGNVFYLVFIMSTLGAFFPALGAGDTPLAIGIASVLLWTFFLLIRGGARQAAAINHVVTVAKVVPILVFVALCAFALDPAVFAANWGGGADAGSLLSQVQGTMLVTVFVFLGVEGASVYSRHAKRRRDVGRATTLGFLSVFAIFASVTIVSYGILPRDQIAALHQPSMAGVLEAVVGPWGGMLVSIGLIVSVLGAYLAWVLMAAEVLLVAARDGDMPRFLRADDRRDVPTSALLMSSAVAQVGLIVVLFSADAFDFALNLTSSLVLIPYLLAAGYGVRVAAGRDAAAPDESRRPGALLIAVGAALYAVFLLVAAGVTYLLVSALIYAPATVLFAMTRREAGRRVFSRREAVVFAVVLVGAVVAIVALAADWISI
ncbi:basic amino acid/polyamine antiporter [Microbacterium fluvii]|uniref:basic amino acid/polyamine antiporter n=1 Tax=Microbacterium fluvii TaxID=415215 RepID=UPI0021D19775|nr:basic amino acid/polyamine antiporter [Microbacterium fluvii]MCU4672361.1 basic amino acid/polyamine antiporter [Microbacterium fluvii]